MIMAGNFRIKQHGLEDINFCIKSSSFLCSDFFYLIFLHISEQVSYKCIPSGETNIRTHEDEEEYFTSNTHHDLKISITGSRHGYHWTILSRVDRKSKGLLGDVYFRLPWNTAIIFRQFKHHFLEHAVDKINSFFDINISEQISLRLRLLKLVSID